MLVALLGLSADPNRYASLAAHRLMATGHRVVGINPRLPIVSGVDFVAEISQLPPGVHTLSVYVRPARSSGLAEALLKYGFSRVIFNPGSENSDLAAKLLERGVEVVEACTLVMLSTRIF